MEDKIKEVFGPEDLAAISKTDRPKIFRFLTDLALNELKKNSKIINYTEISHVEGHTDDPDFRIIPRNQAAVLLKVLAYAEQSDDFHKQHPKIYTVSVMDLRNKGYTKPVEMIANDIRHRLKDAKEGD